MLLLQGRAKDQDESALAPAQRRSTQPDVPDSSLQPSPSSSLTRSDQVDILGGSKDGSCGFADAMTPPHRLNPAVDDICPSWPPRRLAGSRMSSHHLWSYRRTFSFLRPPIHATARRRPSSFPCHRHISHLRLRSSSLQRLRARRETIPSSRRPPRSHPAPRLPLQRRPPSRTRSTRLASLPSPLTLPLSSLVDLYRRASSTPAGETAWSRPGSSASRRSVGPAPATATRTAVGGAG